MSFGQKYKSDTFDQRFGGFPTQDPREQLRQMMEYDNFIRQPGAIMPGTQERFGDPTKVISQNPYGAGYGPDMLRQLAGAFPNDVGDRGIPTPQYVTPTPEAEPSPLKVLQGGPKTNMPSQEEIDATLREMERLLGRK